MDEHLHTYHPLTLANLGVGAVAVAVAAINGIASAAPEHVAMRLRHLGFRVGNSVQKIRVAPLGDPAVYRVLGYEMCLRRHEARHVEVEVAG